MKKNPYRHRAAIGRSRGGFTLIEMLVVITIIAVLVVLSFFGVNGLIDKAKKTQALGQFRDLEVGLTMFSQDYQRPPIPASKRPEGWDTIYGDENGNYHTGFLVAALSGKDDEFLFGDEAFAVRDVNPRYEEYLQLPVVSVKRNGVWSEDGRLYDPWGREIMIAVNGMQGTSLNTFPPFREGRGDQMLHTWGLAEYTETKPRDQPYVFWSYGKDGKKGDNGPSAGAIVPFAGSDDVISW